MMTDPTLFKLLGIAIFLIFLLILSYYIARNGRGTIYQNKKKLQRIHILESQILDPRRKVYLVSIDRSEYIILAGATEESIIPYKSNNEPIQMDTTVDIQGNHPFFGPAIVSGGER